MQCRFDSEIRYLTFYMVDFILLLYSTFFYDDDQFEKQSFIDPNLLCWGYK